RSSSRTTASKKISSSISSSIDDAPNLIYSGSRPHGERCAGCSVASAGWDGGTLGRQSERRQPASGLAAFIAASIAANDRDLATTRLLLQGRKLPIESFALSSKPRQNGAAGCRKPFRIERRFEASQFPRELIDLLPCGRI